MTNWYLKSVGRLAAAIGESDRYSSEHLRWLRSGYVCQQCYTTLVKGRANETARCYDADGKRVGLLSIRRRGKTFECPVCNHRWPFRIESASAPSSFLGRFIRIYVTLCAMVIVLGAAFFGTYVAMNANRLFPARDSIVIYGRDSCGFTSAIREDLTAQSIPFVYANIDKPFIDEEMWHHLRKVSGHNSLHTAHLPIVLINGQVLERPETALVVDERNLAAATRAHGD